MNQTRRQVLELTFVAENGDAKMRIPDPKEDLTSEDILTAMVEIIDGNAFTSSKGDFVTPKSAKVIETITEEFDIVVD